MSAAAEREAIQRHWSSGHLRMLLDVLNQDMQMVFDEVSKCVHLSPSTLDWGDYKILKPHP